MTPEVTTSFLIQADARHLPLADASVDAVVCDPPYGLEFMGKEWDGVKGFRRAANPDDVGRENVFGRTSRTSPESSAAWRVNAGMSKPGIGERNIAWPSFGGGDSANATCATCGGRMRGKKKCACGNPVWMVKGRPIEERQNDVDQKRVFEAWCVEWAKEALRVLKPGGHLIAFGGTRMFHRLACAIENAGFEMRDCLMWLYGSGFPKSKNIGDGRGTALKPAWEPAVLARKPLSEGTVEANVARWSVGCIFIDAGRIAGEVPTTTQGASSRIYGGGKGLCPEGMQLSDPSPLGRWPANVAFDEPAADQLDLQTGISVSRIGKPRGSAEPGDGWGMTSTGAEYDDAGGASRFFYVAKASRAERNAGCDALPVRPLNWSSGEQNPGSFQAEGTDRNARNYHPTVKPVQLMRYLCRLVTPPGGTVLDCFAGSGSTGMAAVFEGFNFIGVERERDYLDIARARNAWALANPQGGDAVEWPRQRKGEEVADEFHLFPDTSKGVA